MKMKTTSRSSRFFFVLLHLIGVSRRRRYSEWLLSMPPSVRPRSGILGVQPLPMLMEQIELSTASRTTSTAIEIGKHIDAWHYIQPSSDSSSSHLFSTTAQFDETKTRISPLSIDPIWLQFTHIDSTKKRAVGDEKTTRGSSSMISTSTKSSTLCLGPTGSFSECGDATLWTLRPMQLIDRKEKRKKKIRQILEFLRLQPRRNRKNENDDPPPTIGWSFELVDMDYDSIPKESNGEIVKTENKESNKIIDFQWLRRLFRFMRQRDKTTSSTSKECLQYNTILKTIEVQKCSSNQRRHPRRKNPFLHFLNNRKKATPIDHQRDVDNNGFVWIINQDGLLQAVQSTLSEENSNSQRRPRNKQTTDSVVDEKAISPLCLGRNNQTLEALLVPCSSASPVPETFHEMQPSSDIDLVQQTPVKFTFFRYRAVPVTLTTGTDVSRKTYNDEINLNNNKDMPKENENSLLRSSSRSGSDSNELQQKIDLSDDVTATMPSDRDQELHSELRRKNINGNNAVNRKPIIISSKNNDVASIRSNANAIHPGLALSRRINFQDFKGNTLRNSNAILFVSASSSSNNNDNSSGGKKNQEMLNIRRKTESVKKRNIKIRPLHKAIGSTTIEKQSLESPMTLSNPSSTSSEKILPKSTAAVAGKLHHNRIYRHPYIDASTNNIWKDPLTGLEYHTDLCQYLKWNCNERRDRHTLTGVGIYRKGYVIKVYGIAYYVSKRDLLANPNMVQYADTTADELRQQSNFYSDLRSMNKDNQFDRTILIKTNMQLSTETMRSSLQADWSYLTTEMKTTLVGASMEAHPANDDMLAIIRNVETNPSRCSCSQIAPTEYNANPECCARGTELAFTWLKSDGLEVRLNGRLMVSFSRPDIAAGIFYEYLRYDYPISPELRDRVVDGFPFLLSPLIQVKGNSNIIIGHQTSQSIPSKKVLSSNNYFNPFVVVLRSGSRAFEVVHEHTAGFALGAKKIVVDPVGRVAKSVMYTSKVVLQSVVETPQTLNKLMQRDEETIRSLADFGKSVITEADQSREWLVSSIVFIPSTIVKVARQDPQALQSISEFFTSIVRVVPFLSYHENVMSPTESPLEGEVNLLDEQQKQQLRELYFKQLFVRPVVSYPYMRWSGDDEYILHALDEISPMIVNPTMDLTRLIFLSLVHLYLLLIFIVSFPGSYSTKTKLIVSKRYPISRTMSDDDSESETMSQYDRSSSWNDDDFIDDDIVDPVHYFENEDQTIASSASRCTEQHNIFSRAVRKVLSRRNQINKIRTLINENMSSNEIIKKDKSQKESTGSSRRGNKSKAMLRLPKQETNTPDLVNDSSGNPLKKKSLSYFL